ncbi:hypothetical protein MKEN_00498000 [Mycena kentingensis (nom. inval.)]|nr:hypothetical protein MKEN_00498000 [Mycena kentingensis (nom. inval.)]
MPPASTTPIRAITTPLRSPTPAPIPPADQLYEPYAKSVLRRRLTNRVFLYTAVLAVGGAFVWAGLSSAIGVAVGLWAGGILPVVVLRKAYLTIAHTSAASPVLLVQKSLAASLRTRTLHALQAHLLSALCVLAIHATLDSQLPIFIKSRRHPYTFHPVLFLFALNQSVLAGLWVLRSILRDVWVFPFRRPSLIPSPGAILAPAFLSLLALPIALMLSFVVVPILRRVPIVSLAFAFTRSPHLSVLKHVYRVWTLGIFTSALWEATAGVWEWVISEDMHTTPLVRNLVSGISISATPAPTPSSFSSAFSTPARSSPFISQGARPATASPPAKSKPVSIYTHLAYQELHRIAIELSESPKVDSKHAVELFDVDGLVWGTLARETLILIGREYQTLLGKGVPPPDPIPPAATPAPSAFGTPAAPPATPGTTVAGITNTPLLKQNIFAAKTPNGKSTPESPVARIGAALASGETLEGIVGPVVDALPVPDLGVRKQLKAYVPAVDVDVTKYVRLPGWVKSVLEVSLPKAWTQPRMGRAVGEWAPRREVCVEAIEVLTHFTCASLKVDRFGVAQRDIPRILEALLAFLGAVESAQAELRAKAEDAATPLEEKEDLDRARLVLGNLGDALKDGVTRIVGTFGDKLRAFKFPPRTAATLQEFVNYNAVV